MADTPFEIILHAEVGSTMEAARTHLKGGHEVPFWCLAEAQTAGRGRRGRVWQSPRGNFYGTLVFRPAEGLPRHIYTFMLAIALREAIAEHAPQLVERLSLKWPNDLLLDGRKLAGILAEAEDGFIFAGMGVNIAARAQVEYPTASLAEEGAEVAPLVLARAVHARFFSLWKEAEAGGLSRIMQRWAAYGPSIGAEISVNTTTERLRGRYEGVDEHARLLLKTDKGLITVTTGDVSF